MDIGLELYKVFCVTARCKSLSLAAKQLGVSQSAVSQSLKQLETRLDARLFNRQSRGVTLTPMGEMLFSYADDACTLLSNAEKKFQDMKTLKSGNVRIGASDTVSLFLSDILGRYNRQFPAIQLKLVNNTTPRLIEMLKCGDVDIAFINTPIEDESGLELQPFMKINDCFAVGSTFSHLAHRTLNFYELCKYPVLMLHYPVHKGVHLLM